MAIAPSLPPREPVGQVDRRVQNPVHGTEGKHFATMLQAFVEGEAAKGSAGFGGGLGVNDKKEYFVEGSFVHNTTPVSTQYLRAIRDTSDSDILGRADPIKIGIVTTKPVPLAGKLDLPLVGPLPVGGAGFLTGSNVTAPGLNLNLAGFGTAETVGMPPDPNGMPVSATVANVYQLFNNRPGVMNAHLVEGLTRVLNMGKGNPELYAAQKATDGLKPFGSLDKNHPSLFSSVAVLGRSHVDDDSSRTGPLSRINIEQTELLVIKPLKTDEIPPAFKAVIDTVAKLQHLPNRAPLLQYLNDIEASPKLRAAMQSWVKNTMSAELPATETITSGGDARPTPEPRLPGPVPLFAKPREEEDKKGSGPANATLRPAA